MVTLQQLIKKPRKNIQVKTKSPALNKCPQRRGVCIKIYTRSPKKPNSAKRQVAKVHLFGTTGKSKQKSRVICYIPGIGHTLSIHSIVLLRGGRVKDLPGVQYHLIPGKYDFTNKHQRRIRRSIYGVKKPRTN